MTSVVLSEVNAFQVHCILKKRADVSVADNDGSTALHVVRTVLCGAKLIAL